MSFASDAVRHVFSVAESEPDAVRRAAALTDLGVMFSEEMQDAVARTYIDLAEAGYRHSDIVQMFGYTNRTIRSWARRYAKERGIHLRIRREVFEPDEEDVLDLTHLMQRQRADRLRREL